MRKEMVVTINDIIDILKVLSDEIKEDDKLLARLITYTAERLEAYIS